MRLSRCSFHYVEFVTRLYHPFSLRPLMVKIHKLVQVPKIFDEVPDLRAGIAQTFFASTGIDLIEVNVSHLSEKYSQRVCHASFLFALPNWKTKDSTFLTAPPQSTPVNSNAASSLSTPFQASIHQRTWTLLPFPSKSAPITPICSYIERRR